MAGAGLVDKILDYVNEPWKIAAVVFLGLFGIIGATIWEKRAEIAEQILEGTVVPRLEPQRFPAIAQQLLDSTYADAAVLGMIDTASGRLVNVDGRRRGDEAWRPRPDARSIYQGVTVDQVVDIIAGHVVCDDVPDQGQQRVDVQLGLKRRCIVAVPPILEVLVGSLSIGWVEPPPAVSEPGYKIELQRLAMKLATW